MQKQDQSLIYYFRKIEGIQQYALNKTLSAIQNSPSPQLKVNKNGSSEIQRERLLEVLREDWFKTYSIRDYHLRVYEEKRRIEKE